MDGQSRSLYEEFRAEREEILKHKWIESEKSGCDIGFDRALVDWITRHRDTWKSCRPAFDSGAFPQPHA